MKVLVDSSVWISYFRAGKNAELLEFLMDENLIVINEVILSELVPVLKVRNQLRLIRLLETVDRLPMSIDWQGLIDLSASCLSKGMTGIGLPDLMIAQNLMQHEAMILSEDNHFQRLQEVCDLKTYP